MLDSSNGIASPVVRFNRGVDGKNGRKEFRGEKAEGEIDFLEERFFRKKGEDAVAGVSEFIGIVTSIEYCSFVSVDAFLNR